MLDGHAGTWGRGTVPEPSLGWGVTPGLVGVTAQKVQRMASPSHGCGLRVLVGLRRGRTHLLALFQGRWGRDRTSSQGVPVDPQPLSSRPSLPKAPHPPETPLWKRRGWSCQSDCVLPPDLKLQEDGLRAHESTCPPVGHRRRLEQCPGAREPPEPLQPPHRRLAALCEVRLPASSLSRLW